MNLVCPPTHRHAPPLGEQRRVVSFGLGQLADTISERDGVDKVVECIHPADLFDAIQIEFLPVVMTG